MHIDTPAPDEDGWHISTLQAFARDTAGNVLLLLVLLAAERLFLDRGFYASLIQHPYWIIVLIASVQSGLFVGVAVAVAATMLLDLPQRPADADITVHYLQAAILPLQWLMAALCIGLFRTSELARMRATEAELARLQDRGAVLADEVVRLEAHLESVQLAALSRDESASLTARNLDLQRAALPTLPHETPSSVDTSSREGRVVKLAHG